MPPLQSSLGASPRLGQLLLEVLACAQVGTKAALQDLASKTLYYQAPQPTPF